jgi:hypothetical protein
MITMSTDNMDIMEWLTSDVVTITRRYLAAYRKGEGDPDSLLVRYCANVRELLDAALSGAGRLAGVEHELALHG